MDAFFNIQHLIVRIAGIQACCRTDGSKGGRSIHVQFAIGFSQIKSQTLRGDFGDIRILDQPGRFIGSVGVQEQVLTGVARIDPTNGGPFAQHGTDYGGKSPFAGRFLDRSYFLGGQVSDCKVLHHLHPNVDFRAIAVQCLIHAFTSISSLFQGAENRFIREFVINFIELFATNGHSAGAVVSKRHDQGLAVFLAKSRATRTASS